MVEGSVNESLEPVVEVGLRREEVVTTIPALVDTGFGGYLCLAEVYVNQLDMTFEFAEPYELANGDVIVKDVFRGRVVFDGRVREVEIILTASEDTLIGSALLQEYTLHIDYLNRTVRIERAAGERGVGS
jgi:clan AA aspartic protease